MKLGAYHPPYDDYLIGSRLRARLADVPEVGYFKTDYITPQKLAPYRVIVTAHSDYPLNQQRFSMAPPHLLRWFARHAEMGHPNVEGVPVGHQEPVTQILGNTDKIFQKSQESKKNKNLAYICWRDETFPSERRMVRNLFQDHSWVTVDPYVRNQEGYDLHIDNLYNHKFVIAPRGNGPESIRMWDALALRSIPIVKRNPALKYFEELPILFVDDWHEVANEEFLERKYEEMMNTHYNFEKLSLNYWFERISTLARSG